MCVRVKFYERGLIMNTYTKQQDKEIAYLDRQLEALDGKDQISKTDIVMISLAITVLLGFIVFGA